MNFLPVCLSWLDWKHKDIIYPAPDNNCQLTFEQKIHLETTKKHNLTQLK